MTPRFSSLSLLLLAFVAAVFGFTKAEIDDDIVWHNRYHALLAMSAYGNYNETCTSQTFTAENLDETYPGTKATTWTILETFGPTASGCEGYVAAIASMNKTTLVFKGDYNLEKNWPNATVPFSSFGYGDECPDCTVNAFALQGYLEAKEATNGWAKSIAYWRTTDAFFSITGHGLGGAHSLIASIDLGVQGVSSFVHSYGTPRIFNPAGAAYYKQVVGKENDAAAYWLTERGVANADSFVETFPRSADYEFTDTAFLWYGVNATFKMNREVCEEDAEDAACAPLTPLDDSDHYFYFCNVGDCGGAIIKNETAIANFIASASASASSVTPTVTLTVSSATSSASSSAVSSTVSSAVSSETSAAQSVVVAAVSSTSAPGVSAAAASTSATTTTGGAGKVAGGGVVMGIAALLVAALA